ncbi:MAG: hypothetical protein ACI4B3_10220, partial [Prevotella sp.]
KITLNPARDFSHAKVQLLIRRGAGGYAPMTGSVGVSPAPCAPSSANQRQWNITIAQEKTYYAE